jgi:hypothetical protein
MWPAFPAWDSYSGSAPPRRQRSTQVLPATGLAGRRGGSTWPVPTFVLGSVDREVASWAPAASPRVRRRPSRGLLAGVNDRPQSRPRSRACAAARPISTRLEPVLPLRALQRWFLTPTFPTCLPGPGRLAVPTIPSLSGLLPPSLRSQIGLPPASPACRDRPAAGPYIPARSHHASWRTITMKNEVSPSRHWPSCWTRRVTATRRFPVAVASGHKEWASGGLCGSRRLTRRPAARHRWIQATFWCSGHCAVRRVRPGLSPAAAARSRRGPGWHRAGCGAPAPRAGRTG